MRKNYETELASMNKFFSNLKSLFFKDIKDNRKDEERRRYLIDRARSQIIDNDEVRKCWEYVIEGLWLNYIGENNIPKLIQALKDKQGRGYNELDFDWDFENSDRIEVFFVNQTRSCPGNLLIKELEILMKSYV